MVSIVIAGVISALIPEAFFNQYMENQFMSMLIMAAIGIPMYMCATSSAFRNAALAKARGQAAKILTDAESYREEKINRAKGEAVSFTQQVTAYQGAIEITKTRLYLETLENTLFNVKKFIKPPEGTARSIDLWFQETAEPLNRDFVVTGMRPYGDKMR